MARVIMTIAELHKVAYLGHFTERAAFFSEIDDHAAATILGLLYRLLDSEDDYG